MHIKQLLVATAIAMTLASPAFAQDATGTAKANNPYGAGYETQRDIDQQKRIESGLDSGSLNTKEAARLEHGESAIDKTEAKDMKDGSLSAKDRYQIAKMQNKESKAVYNQKHDAQQGNPNSLSSRRMQRDVGRNVAQEKRIRNGLKSGDLNKREYSKLQRNQSWQTRGEYASGRNGRVGKNEQRGLRYSDNRDSHRIHRYKNNG